MKTFIDPPSGGRYGFPKELPEGVKDVKAWLVSEGYPQAEVDRWPDGVPCGMWSEDNVTDHLRERG